LSNTNILILPARLTLIGEMQNISAFFNLRIAKRVPTAKAAGSAGGTVIIRIFSEASIINLMLNPYVIITGRIEQIPMKAITNPIKMNFSESFVNLKLNSEGYRISLMRLPFAVRKFVFLTRP
jgi:hypothetical protein